MLVSIFQWFPVSPSLSFILLIGLSAVSGVRCAGAARGPQDVHPSGGVQ